MNINQLEQLLAAIENARQSMMHKRLFTVREAARLLDMSQYAIRRLIKQRKLAVVRIEQKVFLTETSMSRLVRKNTFPLQYD